MDEFRARRVVDSLRDRGINAHLLRGGNGKFGTCTCGSSLCRGVITGEDWRRPELQARYGDHWIPALLARIEQA